MKRSLLWLLRLVTHNFGWKVLSIAIGMLIWVFVASEPELASFASVPLQYKDLPDELEISSPLVDSVYLELRGPSGDLRGFSDARGPAVVLDMSSVRPGERTFSIGNGNVKLPRGLHLVRAIPAQVRFDFERRLIRTVPVRARFTEPPPGYAVASVSLSPPDLRLVGPASRVQKIESVMTDPVDISHVVGSSEIRVNAFVQDPYVRFQSSAQVVVTVTMKKQ